MENTGIWVALVIIIFVLGSIFGLRISPREKALGIMRDKARKIGLHPRLVVAPEWTKVPKATESRASMVAYYSILLPEARLPLMRARVVDNKLELVQGDDKFADFPIALKGIYAIDMQANCVGVYWDEEADLRATQLDEIKTLLHALTEL
ncbi:ammonium transporter [Acinetobacter bohemicus]|uniref:ammonium transporter n=1 Tax=Acinetobacter TaxID=469 RepID=UPI0011753DDE|nr:MULTISPECIES: ammonium transporter [Acinetobacter]MCO8041432.1 ammonium transporter [Acinetobacter sp. S4400-12]MCO8044898.1 ammonium transporter [Acinetobacter sp. S4397-1]MCU7223877.1 ammonium transporter [Acinetobacter bohemicus]TQR60771.1 ammonium transporter [Acinetobacter sp. RF14B]TSH76001.1 ammonium transporter [Acinetobacter sp. RF15A]